MSIASREIDESLSVVDVAFLTLTESQSSRSVEITDKFISKDSDVTFVVQFDTSNFSISSEFNT